MDIHFSEPQDDYFYSEAKATAVVAGYGAGKTDISKHRASATMFEYAAQGANTLYLAPTYQLIKDIWYPKVEEFFDDHNVSYNINKADHVIDIYGAGVIYCRSMEHPKRLVGFEVLDAFLDELDTIPKEKGIEVFRKAKARCRQKIQGKKNQLFVSTTPEGFAATHQLFKKEGGEDRRLIQMSTYSNEHNLPDDYIADLLASYPPALIEAYINGVFVNLTSGSVWGSFDRKLNHSDETVLGEEPLRVGMDFNVGRGCAVVQVIRSGNPIAVDEIVNTFDTPDTIRTLKEKYPKNTITVYPDASGKSRKSVNATLSDIQLLRDAGMIIRVNSTNPSIKDRVTATNAMFCNALGERRYLVNTDKCPVFTEALEQQVYDKNGLPAKGDGEGDDITDSGSYPIAYEYPILRKSAIKLSVGGF